jgi:hypothetical protein
MHVRMGVCFRCNGSGIEPLKQKVYIFLVVINDGHPLPGLARHKIVIERTVKTCAEQDVRDYLTAQKYQPSKREGATGRIDIVSIELANIATKLVLR